MIRAWRAERHPSPEVAAGRAIPGRTPFFRVPHKGHQEFGMLASRRFIFSVALLVALFPRGASAQNVTDEKLVNPELISPFARVAESVMPAVVSIRMYQAPPVPSA